MWIPDAERLKMSAAEVEGGERHLPVSGLYDECMRRPSTASASCAMMLCGRHMSRGSSASLGAHWSWLSEVMQSPRGLQARWSTAPHSLRS